MKIIKPTIGISQCLTDCFVRYDAKSQFNSDLINTLEQHFKLVPVCPEVECGMGVPRPPIQLVETEQGIRVIGRDDKQLDVTDKLNNYSNTKVQSLYNLSGYVFKTRSPSCGVNSTPVFSLQGEITKFANGVFVNALQKHYPQMPVIDDAEFADKTKLEQFILQAKEVS